MDKQLACTFFDLSDLDLILKKLEKEAHENQGNTLLSDEQYFVKYVEMRKNQKLVVEKLCHDNKGQQPSLQVFYDLVTRYADIWVCSDYMYHCYGNT